MKGKTVKENYMKTRFPSLALSRSGLYGFISVPFFSEHP